MVQQSEQGPVCQWNVSELLCPLGTLRGGRASILSLTHYSVLHVYVLRPLDSLVNTYYIYKKWYVDLEELMRVG